MKIAAIYENMTFFFHLVFSSVIKWRDARQTVFGFFFNVLKKFGFAAG